MGGIRFIITKRLKKLISMVVIAFLVTILLSTIIFASFSNPLEGKNVVIDPGHGGIDGGTNDGMSFLEKDINLQISLKLRKLLSSDKANTGMTRESDVSLNDVDDSSPIRHERDLTARVKIFNSGGFDLFVSIHVNSSGSSAAMGPMVLYSSKNELSCQLAEAVQHRLNEHVKTELHKQSGYEPVESNAFILRNSGIPGVLVETGFISNPQDKHLLQDDEYQLKLAKAICNGIKDYYRNSHKSAKKDKIDDDRYAPLEILNSVKNVSR